MKESREEDLDFFKSSKSDVRIIALVLLFSVASITWTVRTRGEQSPKAGKVLIYQNNNVIEEAGLDKNKIITLLNGKMRVEIKGGKVRVVQSDCPRQVCVNTGWIHYSGQTIVCVPHKVLIEIQSTDSPIVDAVSY